MKRLGALTCVAATCFAVLAIPGQTSAQRDQFTIFDPPGSTFTQPTSINPAGAITGWYEDVGMTTHGFLRAPDGTFTIVDPPGSRRTEPMAINPAGAITGWYDDDLGVGHGFLRAPDGTFTTFDPPGSASTYALSINPAGAVAGDYQDFIRDENGLPGVHGFVRAPDGAFTVFDIPGWSVPSESLSINPAGEITGLYFSDTYYLPLGFLRNHDGTFTTFKAPGRPSMNPRPSTPRVRLLEPVEMEMGCFTVACGGNDSDSSAPPRREP